MSATMTTTAPKQRNKSRNSAAYDLAMQRWSDAIDALQEAHAACAALSEALDDLTCDELDKCVGEPLREESWHFGWASRRAAELLENTAPHEVYTLRRDAI